MNRHEATILQLIVFALRHKNYGEAEKLAAELLRIARQAHAQEDRAPYIREAEHGPVR